MQTESADYHADIASRLSCSGDVKGLEIEDEDDDDHDVFDLPQ